MTGYCNIPTMEVKVNNFIVIKVVSLGAIEEKIFKYFLLCFGLVNVFLFIYPYIVLSIV